MEREINQRLFSEATASDSQSQNPSKMTQRAGYDNADIQILSAQVSNLKEKLKETSSIADQTQGRVEALAKASKLKLDRLQSKTDSLEQACKRAFQDLGQKFMQLSGKVTNSRLSEDKLESMLERHNQVVQSFEARLSQMQKVINEQEMQLLSHKSALKETRQQLEQVTKAYRDLISRKF